MRLTATARLLTVGVVARAALALNPFLDLLGGSGLDWLGKSASNRVTRFGQQRDNVKPTAVSALTMAKAARFSCVAAVTSLRATLRPCEALALADPDPMTMARLAVATRAKRGASLKGRIGTRCRVVVWGSGVVRDELMSRGEVD